MDPNYNPANDPNYPTTNDFVPPDLFPAHLADGTVITVNREEYRELERRGLLVKPLPDVTTAVELTDMYNPSELPMMGQLR